jgi:hypothetical protein
MASRTTRRTFSRGTPKTRRELTKHKEPYGPNFDSRIHAGSKEFRYHGTYKTKREAKGIGEKGKRTDPDRAGYIRGYRIRPMKDGIGRTWYRLYTRGKY